MTTYCISDSCSRTFWSLPPSHAGPIKSVLLCPTIADKRLCIRLGRKNFSHDSSKSTLNSISFHPFSFRPRRAPSTLVKTQFLNGKPGFLLVRLTVHLYPKFQHPASVLGQCRITIGLESQWGWLQPALKTRAITPTFSS